MWSFTFYVFGIQTGSCLCVPEGRLISVFGVCGKAVVKSNMPGRNVAPSYQHMVAAVNRSSEHTFVRRTRYLDGEGSIRTVYA